MKNARQKAIVRIIAENDVETQRELSETLRASGYDATQATVSRDIKELSLIKEQSASGKYRYTVGQAPEERDYSARLRSIFREGVNSCAVAGNIVVIKTLPGLANAASSAIDGMGVRGLVGTVAGDDTAFLAMTDADTAERFCAEVELMIK
jgi:transcriptional regulator of arginine metabolism